MRDLSEKERERERKKRKGKKRKKREDECNNNNNKREFPYFFQSNRKSQRLDEWGREGEDF